MPTDQELVAAMARGDREALDLLYRRHAPWLAGRLAASTSSRDLAEEALQDTFLAAWRGAKGFRATGDVGAWLWGIGRRRLVSLVRRVKPAPPSDPETHAAAADERILRHEDRARVRSAVKKLPSQFREAIEVVVFQESSLEDASQTLGVPVGTLKSRLSRARDELRRELEES